MRPKMRARYADLKDLVKDLGDIFEAIPDTEIVEYTGQYFIGMVLPLKSKPRAIELINCMLTQQPGAVTGFQPAVEWAWKPAGAEILYMLDGVVGPTEQYRFTFRVTY
jgi:hypothetical protein